MPRWCSRSTSESGTVRPITTIPSHRSAISSTIAGAAARPCVDRISTDRPRSAATDS